MTDITNYAPEEKSFVDKQKVDMYLMTNQKFFPTSKLMFLKEKLYSLTEDKFALLNAIELKDPTTLLIVSLLVGGWGVDRFMLKDNSMGILKLLTGGCCGILTILDWFSVQNKAREFNFRNVMMLL